MIILLIACVFTDHPWKGVYLLIAYFFTYLIGKVCVCLQRSPCERALEVVQLTQTTPYALVGFVNLHPSPPPPCPSLSEYSFQSCPSSFHFLWIFSGVSVLPLWGMFQVQALIGCRSLGLRFFVGLASVHRKLWRYVFSEPSFPCFRWIFDMEQFRLVEKLERLGHFWKPLRVVHLAWLPSLPKSHSVAKNVIPWHCVKYCGI